MPAPLTAKQIALYVTKRRAGSRQKAASAEVGLSMRSAHRIAAASNRKLPNHAVGGVLIRWVRCGRPCWCL